MKRNTEHDSAPASTDGQIIGIAGLARMLGISPATIASKRTRAPEELPPSYWDRPARWRRETVLRWIAQREALREADAAKRARPVRTRVLRTGS